MDADSYLPELARYVVLNPVRAGMVADLGHSSWSSYQGTLATPAARPPSPEWLANDRPLRHFNPHFGCDQSTTAATLSAQIDPRQRTVAQQRYVDHVSPGVGLSFIWEQLSGQINLRSETYVQRVQAHLAQQLRNSEQPANTVQEVRYAQRKPAKRASTS
jgi:putative transposase